MESDITTQILIDIREELRARGQEIRETNARLDRLTTELAQTRQDLGRRIDQTNRQLVTTETRLVTEISALRSAVTETEPERRDFRERLEQCERDIAELRQRD